MEHSWRLYPLCSASAEARYESWCRKGSMRQAPQVGHWRLSWRSAECRSKGQALNKVLKWYHFVMILVWLGLAVPGVLVWKESIVFVIILSLYANVETSFSAYQAARSEEKK
jgi:hypothetical protein